MKTRLVHGQQRLRWSPSEKEKKSVKEAKCADAVADALTRTIFCFLFSCREKLQVELPLHVLIVLSKGHKTQRIVIMLLQMAAATNGRQ